ncbi:selenocysteine-specific translation elongation factor [Lichenihabitans sp. Uapishka_5]|uniref:selenocysteine-specific translation elongation factor n=1 Tax=Lichenihabitans sp. Uapishka_5 TaxID=3037302 RepID=UPI0029E7D6D7|nr:selenocysteine-specific translation elongation factor [Lichenihabitans sp. Uapishka_5]MDX7951521.1 selenocysteine-specific translation elongation factor [Lichenihabitans sp. Uapishka_5]
MIVGTAGHIDHGKTALVKALTGVDADRLKEEKARGITIDLGFAYQPLADDRITGFVDVPGHERFVHTMLAGASGIDLALLVVAADDGVMPQTREHVAILDLLGIRRGVVALSKADLADAARRAAVEAEIAALLAPTGLRGATVVPVSTITGEGVEALRQRLAEAERDTAAAAPDGAFRLAVDRCFTLAGAGVVVTGTVLSGTVNVGDRVVVSPSGLPARVRSIHAQNRPADRGMAGQRCALNLAGEAVGKDAIARGDVVLTPGLHAPTERIDATLRLLPGETKPIGPWFPARLHLGSTEVGVRIVPLDGPVAPGRERPVQLVLDRPVAATVGDRFVIRDVSAQRTMGGGRLLDLRPPARKRRTPERLAQLDALRADDPATAFATLLTLHPFWVDAAAFGRDHAMGDAQARALEDRAGTMLPAGATRLALGTAAWERFAHQLATELATFHAEHADLQGLGRERLRLKLEPRLPAEAFRLALERQADAGAIVLEGAFVRLPGHAVRLSEADETLWHRVAPLLAGDGLARFRPPRVRDLAGALDAPEPDLRRLLKACGRLGRVDQVAHDHFFLRSVTAEMALLARDVAAEATGGTFTAAEFRDRMDNGRKVAIQILDFFDRHGLTLRRGDLRRINPHRLDLFGPATAIRP